MIAIIDYGMGNLRSVQKGFEKVGHPAEITSDPKVVARADRVVLPGVGAFEDAMAELKRFGLVDSILETIEADRPMLGICLGLQLLFDFSLENGRHEGLGVIPGDCVRFEIPREFSVPHMGWNQIEPQGDVPLLKGIDPGTYVYFVHSYYVRPTDRAVIATETEYGGMKFCSMIQKGNLFASQFHPEKSQEKGLQILKNFAEL